MDKLTMEIIEMSIDDYKEAACLWQSMEEIGLDEDVDSLEGITKYLLRNPGLSFVARAEGRLIGAVLCGHDGRRGYLHHLAVLHQYRLQGIGRALVERSLAKLAEVGINKCDIFVFAYNQEGQNFWQKTGWMPGQDLCLMSKNTI